MWYRIIISGREDVLRILNDNSLLNNVRNLSPESKYQTTAAYLLNLNTDPSQITQIINSLKLIDNKYNKQLVVSKNGIQYDKYHFKNFKDFKVYVDKLSSFIKQKSEKIDPEKIKSLIPTSFQIKRIDNQSEACQLGHKTMWCVAEPGGSAWDSYANRAKTFYFVFDPDNKQYDYQKVAVMVDPNGYLHFYDEQNEYLSNEVRFRYINYLESRGINLSKVFKPVQMPDDVKRIQQSVEKENPSADWFEAIPHKYKVAYVMKHRLTPEQLELLIEKFSWDLVEIYVKTGKSIPPSQLQMIQQAKPGLINSYNKYRRRSLDHIYSHYENNEEQMEGYACAYEDYELAMELMEQNPNFIRDWRHMLPETTEFSNYVRNHTK